MWEFVLGILDNWASIAYLSIGLVLGLLFGGMCTTFSGTHTAWCIIAWPVLGCIELYNILVKDEK